MGYAMKNLLVMSLLVLLTANIFIIEKTEIDEGAKRIRVYRVCVDGYEYVITPQGIAQSFINSHSAANFTDSHTAAKKCNHLDDPAKEHIKLLLKVQEREQ